MMLFSLPLYFWNNYINEVAGRTLPCTTATLFESKIFDRWSDEFLSLQYGNINCIQLGRGVPLSAEPFAIICLYATTLILFLFLLF